MHHKLLSTSKNAPILLIIQTVLQIFQLAFELFNYTKFYPMHEVYFYPPKINVCHFHDDTIILCPLFGSKSLVSAQFQQLCKKQKLFQTLSKLSLTKRKIKFVNDFLDLTIVAIFQMPNFQVFSLAPVDSLGTPILEIIGTNITS